MYLPSQFSETRAPVLQALMRDYPLATLVTMSAAGLEANHIPLLFCPGDATTPGRLQGHVARANGLWRDTDRAIDVLAIFQGPQGYISPSWYPTKQEDGKVVPTWNYAVVHARGTLRIHDDPAWVHDLVSRLTQVHEAGQPAPWAVADAPAGHIAQLARAIVGIEIIVTSLVGKWKTSGNQPAVNRVAVAQALAQQPGDTAQCMSRLVAAHDTPLSDPVA